MSTTPASPPAPGEFLNNIIKAHNLKNDAGLARALKVSRPAISKYRCGKVPIGSSLILRLHTTFGIPVAEIVALTQEQPAA